MADFRSVQTRMWREDEWFDELEDNDARMFWVYLFTNPSSSPAGIYRLTMRTMAHEAHISYDKACELMERFSADKKAYFEGGVVWVVNMRRLQFPDLDGSGAWQIATKMQSDIDAIPDTNPLKGEYLRRNGYPIITLEVVKGKEVKRVSIQYGYPIDTISVNRNITETETETETQPNDTDFAAAVAAWEAGGQMVTKTVADNMGMAIDDWRERGYPGYVADAINEAARQGKLTWAYVDGILSRCAEQGTAPTNKHTGKNGTDPKKPIVTETVKVDYGDGTFGEVEVQTRGT